MKAILKLTIILFILYCTPVFAQSGNIQGTVTTSQGQAVFKTTVKLLNTNYGVLTDAEGKYTIKNLASGNYTISVSAIGYASILKKITLGKGEVLISDFKLAESNQQLNEVTVSSEKRQESVQNIPAAITSLDAKQIKDYRLWDITNLTAIAPSLFTVEHGNSTGANFFNIRGVLGYTNEQAVATYIDGVNQYEFFSAPPLFNDIQSIEILRGPQGTLYGRNAFGGVVNITTRQPGNTSSGYAEISLGNYGQQRYTVSLSGPVVKNKLFASGAFTYNHRGSIYYNNYTKSGYDRREDYSGNFNLRYLPSERWALSLNAKIENDNDRGSYPWVRSYTQVLEKPYEVSSNNTNIERRNNFNTSLQANYYGKDFNFTSVSSYINYHLDYPGGYDFDFSPLNILTGSPDIRQHIYTQEIRLSSPTTNSSKLQWVAGAYGFLQNNSNASLSSYGPDYLLLDPKSGAPFNTIAYSSAKNQGFAFFGQATYAIASQWDVTAGIRYDHEVRKLSKYTDYQKDPNPPVLLTPNRDYRANFNAVTPKLTVSYKPKDQMLIYASYARGFRAGGLNTTAPRPDQVPYDPEHSDNYEIGWKNTFLNNKLKLNLTGFYLEQHNQQVGTSQDGVNQLILNVGEMHNKGIELELSALPLKGFQIDLNASYSYARYASLLLYNKEAKAVVDNKGNQPIYNPPFSSMLAAQYSYDFGNSKQKLTAFLRGEYRYLDKYYFDFVNGLNQPGYSLFNAKTGVTGKNFELNFWARNITDKRYVAYGSFSTFILGTPRTYGTTLIVKF
ncbi:TonB-dependent receptor [Pedobacter sp. PAMC26386]|nr:TonB-dependent receptor [Pedobacter sp. PAMC26386]